MPIATCLFPFGLFQPHQQVFWLKLRKPGKNNKWFAKLVLCLITTFDFNVDLAVYNRCLEKNRWQEAWLFL